MAQEKPLGPGARFSKVPKLYGPFSGVTISSVSQERSIRFIKVVKLHRHISFSWLENMLKDQLSKISGYHFHKGLFGPEKFSGLSRNVPQGTLKYDFQTNVENDRSYKSSSFMLFPISQSLLLSSVKF